ncbi:hypothetical protein CRYUN_Cryun30bG0005600 [Craigia yunnanensis]
MESGLIVFFVTEGESYGAAIWQIPELYGQLNSPQLERIASLDAHVGKINCVLWWPSGRHDKLISINDENLFLWSLDCSKKASQVQSKESAGMLHYLSGGAWDPHDINAVAATCESILQKMNPEYTWDLRKPKIPVKELPGHTHWTWAVTCNPEYDGLILLAPPSAGDESTSESIAESSTQQADPLVNSYSDYEDNVYGLSWSSREPWIFASLSYDGRVVVESIKPFLSRK